VIKVFNLKLTPPYSFKLIRAIEISNKSHLIASYTTASILGDYTMQLEGVDDELYDIRYFWGRKKTFLSLLDYDHLCFEVL
tara:strand:- start:355 stop:597 length:243 start_codon:yes stop_codon:yes gene_type:complete